MTDGEYTAGAPEERPSAWLWHFFLFFRPRTFFRNFAANQLPVLTIACAWLSGMSTAIDRLESRMVTMELERVAADWNVYWIAVAFFGAISGVFVYFVGGWWYRLRIQWSGASDADPALAKRVYLFASQVYALPTLVFTLFESSAFDSPIAAANSPGSAWHMLLLVFPFWSVVTSYFGVRTMFAVRRTPALIWFAILPLLVYSLTIVGFIALMNLDTEPDVEQPEIFMGQEMAFSYPGNWDAVVENSEDGAESVLIEGLADMVVRVMVYPSIRTAEDELQATLETFSEYDEWAVGARFDAWGRFAGEGANGSYTNAGTPVGVRVFVTEEGGRFMECQAFFAESERPFIAPVLELLARSLQLK